MNTNLTKIGEANHLENSKLFLFNFLILTDLKKILINFVPVKCGVYIVTNSSQWAHDESATSPRRRRFVARFVAATSHIRRNVTSI